ncbi:MAG: hypothetical protein BMS9Abin36_0986 [Gammaproteobacteria bacterium]|nr:MAG: hypothetical protein BMS9Abin36_0986 [Gammaproteobacteria bacterium]
MAGKDSNESDDLQQGFAETGEKHLVQLFNYRGLQGKGF